MLIWPRPCNGCLLRQIRTQMIKRAGAPYKFAFKDAGLAISDLSEVVLVVLCLERQTLL